MIQTLAETFVIKSLKDFGFNFFFQIKVHDFFPFSFFSFFIEITILVPIPNILKVPVLGPVIFGLVPVSCLKTSPNAKHRIHVISCLKH